MNKDFLGVKEVAEELGLSERTVRELFKNKVLPGKKIAGKYVTTRDLVKKFIEGGKE